MTSRKAWTDKGKKLARALAKAEGGAVAATYALALFALIAIAGVGFDYARLATMDTELQNAADQAALAAATQLDGQSDSIERATTAAQELVRNQTLLSNDGEGRDIGIDPVLTFYATRANAEAETSSTDDPLIARYVRVSIAAREAFYALTPIVGAISSGDIDAHATAGMGSAICKTPPVMMCNPTGATYDINALIGKGILLKVDGTLAPGDFGFIDVGAGANALGQLLGYKSPPGDCVSAELVVPEPGQMTSVISYFNTRFDIYENVDGQADCYSGGLCPPSDNSRKDVVQLDKGNNTPSKDLCKLANNDNSGNPKGWVLTPSPYRPTEPETYKEQMEDGDRANWPDHMGYPRDICHAWSVTGNCTAGGGRVGDGHWDIDAYWQANYKTNYPAGLIPLLPGLSYVTRYQVYQWERDNPDIAKATRSFASKIIVKDNKDPKKIVYADEYYIDHKAPFCQTGSAPSPTWPDRRVIPVAVMDCATLTGGKDGGTPLDFVDAFLVEPSIKREFNGRKYTDFGDIYVEVIGRTGQGTGGSGAQVVRRDKPYLIR